MNELKDVEIGEIAGLRSNSGFQALMQRVLLDPLARVEQDMLRYPTSQRQREDLLPYWQVLKTMAAEVKEILDECQKEVATRQYENPIGHIR